MRILSPQGLQKEPAQRNPTSPQPPHGISEWDAPSFGVPKKNQQISDFRHLNKHIIRRPFPLPSNSSSRPPHRKQPHLQVKAVKLSFCKPETEYLGDALSRLPMIEITPSNQIYFTDTCFAQENTDFPISNQIISENQAHDQRLQPKNSRCPADTWNESSKATTSSFMPKKS